MTNKGVAITCPCGHLACYHPSAAQQEVRLRATGGQFSGECKGGTSAHCRCVTPREEVIGDKRTA